MSIFLYVCSFTDSMIGNN